MMKSSYRLRATDPATLTRVGFVVSSVLLSASALAADTSAGNGATNPGTLEEIVVTASKRRENVQDVAASVSVQSGEILLQRQQQQLVDYAAYVPGFNVSNGGKAGLAAVNFRGVASVSDAASVGTYVDEVPLGSSSRYGSPANQILDLLPYDLDRLEVLRGPQGTLYGAGSMGGLIKYVLKNPSLTESGGMVGADVGTVDGAGDPSYSVRGTADWVIAKDVLGVRVSLYDRLDPGYIDEVFTGHKDVNEQTRQGGRIALLWKPGDAWSVKLGALISRNEADDGGTVSYSTFQATPTSDGSSIGTFSNPVGDLKQLHPFPQAFDQDLGLYTATIDWSPGSVTVTSASGYTDQTTDTTVDNTTAVAGVSFLPLPPGTLVDGATSVKIKKFTQEFRVTSPQSQRLDWLVGAFYTDEKVDLKGAPINAYLPDYTLLGAIVPGRTQESTYEEYAFFGDATWHFTDRFDVGAGLRFAENTQKVTGTGGSSPSESENDTTWSLSSRYHFTPDVMMYGRIATGYRPGGLNTVLLPTDVPPKVNSDSLTSYEIGLKSEFLDRRALVNVSVFYIDWKDIQLNSTQNGNTILTNGGSATPKGIELATTYSPIDGLVLGAYAAYTESELSSTAPGAFFLEGYQLPGVPEFSYSVTADYAWNLMSDWTASVGGGFRWVDDVWLTGVQEAGRAAPAVEAPSYSLVSLNASVERGPLRLRIYATNLTNERAIQGGLALINLLNEPQQGDFWIAQPRAIGIGFDYKL